MKKFENFRGWGKMMGLGLAGMMALSSWGWSQAVRNVSLSNEAARTGAAYTNNVLPLVQVAPEEWDEERRKDLLPANAMFQLVVGPAAEDRVMAERAIATATNAVPEMLRASFVQMKVFAPMIQWILRRCRPGVTNEESYVSAAAHPAVWRAQDFDLSAIATFARSKACQGVPMIAAAQILYEEYKTYPIKRAEPLVDYPDPRPEVTFAEPSSIGVVLRAPEARRKFRLRAKAWPVTDEAVTFKWVVLSGGYQDYYMRLSSIQDRADLVLEKGYCDCSIIWGAVNVRHDVAVFARYGDGPYGPPAIISFYRIPNEERRYAGDAALPTVEYLKRDVIIPWLYQNKAWTDDYLLDMNGNVSGFTRMRKNGFRGERFSARGEYIVESYADDSPKIAQKVRYFTDPHDSNTLDYEITDEEVRYRPHEVQPKDRGEFPKRRR